MSIKLAIITFPGSNCDYDCFKAAELVGAEPREARDLVEGVWRGGLAHAPAVSRR